MSAPSAKATSPSSALSASALAQQAQQVKSKEAVKVDGKMMKQVVGNTHLERNYAWIFSKYIVQDNHTLRVKDTGKDPGFTHSTLCKLIEQSDKYRTNPYVQENGLCLEVDDKQFLLRINMPKIAKEASQKDGKLQIIHYYDNALTEGDDTEEEHRVFMVCQAIPAIIKVAQIVASQGTTLKQEVHKYNPLVNEYTVLYDLNDKSKAVSIRRPISWIYVKKSKDSALIGFLTYDQYTESLSDLLTQMYSKSASPAYIESDSLKKGRLEICQAIMKVVETLWAQGYCHGNIRPDSIVVEHIAAEKRIKFGLSGFGFTINKSMKSKCFWTPIPFATGYHTAQDSVNQAFAIASQDKEQRFLTAMQADMYALGRTMYSVLMNPLCNPYSHSIADREGALFPAGEFEYHEMNVKYPKNIARMIAEMLMLDSKERASREKANDFWRNLDVSAIKFLKSNKHK